MYAARRWLGVSPQDGGKIDTMAIITCAVNKTLAAIHDRMPVILAPEAFDLWLNGEKVETKTAAALLAPAPDPLLEAYEISPRVNSVQNDGPDLIAPVGA